MVPSFDQDSWCGLALRECGRSPSGMRHSQNDRFLKTDNAALNRHDSESSIIIDSHPYSPHLFSLTATLNAPYFLLLPPLFNTTRVRARTSGTRSRVRDSLESRFVSPLQPSLTRCSLAAGSASPKRMCPLSTFPIDVPAAYRLRHARSLTPLPVLPSLPAFFTSHFLKFFLNDYRICPLMTCLPL